jgi:hypothetical protein
LVGGTTEEGSRTEIRIVRAARTEAGEGEDGEKREVKATHDVVL